MLPANFGPGSVDNLKLMPDDAIVIPQQLPEIGFMSGTKDWTQTMSSFGIAAAAVNVLKYVQDC